MEAHVAVGVGDEVFNVAALLVVGEAQVAVGGLVGLHFDGLALRCVSQLHEQCAEILRASAVYLWLKKAQALSCALTPKSGDAASALRSSGACVHSAHCQCRTS